MHLPSRRSRKGFTLIEVMVAMFAGMILLAGMGTVLYTLFTGMRESQDFATATGRVDLIRQMTFDARTGDSIIFPDTDGMDGDYVFGGNEGDQVMFNSIAYDPVADTTSDVTITWESRRSTAAAPTDPYIVYRFVDNSPESPANPGDDVQTFAQGDITAFDVTRTSMEGFFVRIETTEASEVIEIELAVTLRNVIN
jgi:prepilin-type N-terminal cleavage/methylation domain-containing protein